MSEHASDVHAARPAGVGAPVDGSAAETAGPGSEAATAQAETAAARPRLVVVTGLSGSGKSVVAKCFEDLGYYVVDNLPLPLLRRFLYSPTEQVPGHTKLAVVTDVRAPGFATELPRLLGGLDRTAIDPVLLFLEASDEVLVRRFSETRRSHPLAGSGPAIEGIRRERELLAELRAMADMVLDSSEWSIHEIRGHIYRAFASEPGAAPKVVVSFVSFGFKHGIPYGTDLLFDVRFLPNPHFVPGLRELTGQDQPVRDFLESQPEYEELVARLDDLLSFLLPRYQRENRSYVTVAIGCTGGHHRSVAICERLAQRFAREDLESRVIHRDVTR